NWIAPRSLEALGRSVERIRSLGVLLIVTYRPEFEPQWIGRPHVTALTLNRFGEHEIAAMIDRVVGDKLLPVSIKQDIIERSDGIPLFVEEITKAVLEAESEGAAERAVGAIPSPSVAVPTNTLRREEIELQVALITPLLHIKGYAAPETKAAAERARILIERAEALGEPPEDPLLLFSVLYTVWTSNYVASNGDAVRDLSARFLTLAEKHGATGPLLIAHRIMGIALATTGDIAAGRAHFDPGVSLLQPAEHRALARRFSVDDLVLPVLDHLGSGLS